MCEEMIHSVSVYKSKVMLLFLFVVVLLFVSDLLFFGFLMFI